jgi:ammonia channel protein AmtB
MKQISLCIAYLSGLKKSVKERIFAFLLFVLGLVSICIAANVHNEHVALFFGILFLFCLFAVTYLRSKSMDEDLEQPEDDALLTKPKAKNGDNDSDKPGKR